MRIATMTELRTFGTDTDPIHPIPKLEGIVESKDLAIVV